MIYKAVLTSEEVQKFMSNFFESENCHTTSVCVKPARGVAETHAVVLEPDGAIAYGTLRASFADGILFEDGWHEKFEPVD